MIWKHQTSEMIFGFPIHATKGQWFVLEMGKKESTRGNVRGLFQPHLRENKRRVVSQVTIAIYRWLWGLFMTSTRFSLLRKFPSIFQSNLNISTLPPKWKECPRKRGGIMNWNNCMWLDPARFLISKMTHHPLQMLLCPSHLSLRLVAFSGKTRLETVRNPRGFMIPWVPWFSVSKNRKNIGLPDDKAR